MKWNSHEGNSSDLTVKPEGLRIGLRRWAVVRGMPRRWAPGSFDFLADSVLSRHCKVRPPLESNLLGAGADCSESRCGAPAPRHALLRSATGVEGLHYRG